MRLTAIADASTASRKGIVEMKPTLTEEGISTKGFCQIPQLILPKSTKTVVINLGANKDPILPGLGAGPCAKVLAFEPMVPDSINPHQQVLVIPAAISSKRGLVMMEKFNNGLSSSFNKPASNSHWMRNKEGRSVRVVPTFSLANIINAIPKEVKIDLVYMDIQGYDFDAISSAIEVLKDRGVEYIYSIYEGVKNDFCRHWVPFMESHGYVFVEAMTEPTGLYNPRSRMEKQCAKELSEAKEGIGLQEMDVLWRLANLDPHKYKGKLAKEQLAERTAGRWTGPDYDLNLYQTCEE